MRNLALRNSDTDWIFSLDIDFLPPPNAHLSLLKHRPSILAEYKSNFKKAVFVVPAFEIDSNRAIDTSINDYSIFKAEIEKVLFPTKDEVEKAYKARNLRVFHERQYPRGHAPTNILKWFEYKSSGLYPVDHDRGYEPFLVFNKRTTPEYNEAFEGRYYNKISHIWSLQQLQYKFNVLTNIYITHLNHPKVRDKESLPGNLELFKKMKEKGLEPKAHVGKLNIANPVKSNLLSIGQNDKEQKKSYAIGASFGRPLPKWLIERMEKDKDIIGDIPPAGDTGIELPPDPSENIIKNPTFAFDQNSVKNWECILGTCSFIFKDGRRVFYGNDYHGSSTKFNGYQHKDYSVLSQRILATEVEKEKHDFSKDICGIQGRILATGDFESLDIWVQIKYTKRGLTFTTIYPLEILDTREEGYNILRSLKLDNFRVSSFVLLLASHKTPSQGPVGVKEFELSVAACSQESITSNELGPLYKTMKNIFQKETSNLSPITLVSHSSVEDLGQLKQLIESWNGSNLNVLSLYASHMALTLNLLEQHKNWLQDHIVNIIYPTQKSLPYPEYLMWKTAVEEANSKNVLMVDHNMIFPKCFNYSTFVNQIESLRNEVIVITSAEYKDSCTESSPKVVVEDGFENRFTIRDDRDILALRHYEITPPFSLVIPKSVFPLDVKENMYHNTKSWILKETDKNKRTINLLSKFYTTIAHEEKAYFSLLSEIEQIFSIAEASFA